MWGWGRRRGRVEDWTTAFRRAYFAEIPVDLAKVGEFRAEAFPRSGPTNWLDAPHALIEIDRRRAAGELTEADAAIARQWTVDGHYIAPRLIDPDLIDKVWKAYEAAIAQGLLAPPAEPHGEGDPWPGRTLDAHLKLPVVREIQQHPAILRICDLLLGRKTLPFQTIIGHKGSAQAAHDDSIHMTTYPDGYLIACWVALEDIHADSGPLVYYPRSHRLAPLLSADVGIEKWAFKSDSSVYGRLYEPAVGRNVERLGLTSQTFLARKGDVLFWHAHLLHGGAARNDLALSRKALVCHYFAEGAFTYHDLAGNASRLHKNGLYAPPALDLLDR